MPDNVKTKDRYLIISQMATSTQAFITDSAGTKNKYEIGKNTKIDLKELKVGEYQLKVNSCHIGVEMKLEITK